MRIDVPPGAASSSQRRAAVPGYIPYASPVPVPARSGPPPLTTSSTARARSTTSTSCAIGDAAEAEAFARQFGDRVHGFTFVPRSAGLRRRHARKLARTMLGRCDFLPALEPALRAGVRARDRRARLRRHRAVVGAAAARCRCRQDVPVVGDTHNVEFDVLRRTAAHANRLLLRHYARRQWPATRREERRCGEAVDLVLATSARDRAGFRAANSGCGASPWCRTGSISPSSSPPADAPEPDTILFSGLMSYFPNQQAIRWFLHDVFPAVLRRRPGARLVVAGAPRRAG